MLLTLCYICPPLAVLFCGRPFAMFINMFMVLGGWRNAVNHALVCYADRRGSQYAGNITKAIHKPEWTKPSRRSLPEKQETPLIDDPCVGARGTRFKRKHG